MVIIYVQSLSVEFPDLLLNQINLTRQLYELKKWLWVLHVTVSLLVCVLKHVMVNMINSKVLYVVITPGTMTKSHWNLWQAHLVVVKIFWCELWRWSTFYLCHKQNVSIDWTTC